MVSQNKMKKVKHSLERFGQEAMSFIKKSTRILQYIFKKGNMALWILDGLIIVLIVIVAADVFTGTRKQTRIYSPEASPEISSESPQEAAFKDFTGGLETSESKGWKKLISFGGVGSGTGPVFNVPPKVQWRIVLTTKTDSRKTSLLNLLAYHKEYPQEPTENFTKELENRGDGGGRATDIIQVCDTIGGDYVINIKSTNLEWGVTVETPLNEQ